MYYLPLELSMLQSLGGELNLAGGVLIVIGITPI